MLSKQSMMIIGLLLVGLSLSLVSHATYTPLAGLVLLLTAIGMIQKKYISTKDIPQIFSLAGLATLLGFFSTAFFGVRLMAIWFEPLLSMTSWLPPEWMFPAGLILFAISAIEFNSRGIKGR